ncbi:MAG: Antitoxin Phd YefM, type toxin-antitoxin system [candidate division NC10 bacterium]|jgi:prevent-host-death family protein|nr:Antitoxin Phd YefM, type toxin-antitoxin system [candidate division NC10 bacterium]
MVKRMSAKEARDRFAEILGQVHYGKDTVIVEKQGKPVAAVIGLERYEELLRAWEAPFGVLDRVAAKNAEVDPAQVQADVAEAVAAVRAAARTKGRKRA